MKIQNSIVETKYWHKVDDGKIQCDVCPRNCQLKEDQKGLCFVRARQNNQIVLTSYGRSSGFCIDPIEKKPLNHFYPGTPVFSFGTAGCNLACKFCQNWDMSKSKEMDTLADTASAKDIAKTAKLHGCKSVAYTYNDPVIFLEYAIDTATACREQGIKNIAVTAGYINSPAREEFFSHMDAANVDLKAFTESFYHKICGGHLQPVLETLEYLKKETKVWFELTTLLIPGENDSEDELQRMTQWVVENLGSDVPMHFTAFHPDWKMLNKSPTQASTLTKARKIARNNGVQFAYVGNIHDSIGSSTYCPNCKNILIKRNWYEIYSYTLNGNKCSYCNFIIPGIFEKDIDNGLAHWGSQRLPVRIKS
jgi:pyruvate formate lyase activating enzyme